MLFRIARQIKRLIHRPAPVVAEPIANPIVTDSIPGDADWTLVEPWPSHPITCPLNSDRLEVFLFLQTYYLGGVWESTKDLVQQLVRINRERARLKFTLGIHQDQTDVQSLESLGLDLRITRIR